jgi:3-oxoacyl-[acyl-carrier-protein] synthase III
MLKDFRFRIAGCGTSLPRTPLKNDELARQLGVEEGWIETRCGVETRYRAEEDETTLSLAVGAAEQVLQDVPEFQPEMLICSTFTPEYLLCPTGPAIAQRLSLGPIGAFDLNAACSGAVIGFLTSLNYLATGFVKRILLVCSDTPTKFLNDADRNTRILMGDGAAAMALESTDHCRSRLLSWSIGSDGAGASYYQVPVGGSACPQPTVEDGPQALAVKMEGRALFRFAVEQGGQLMASLIEQAGLRADQVKWVLVHQANLRIIKALQEKVEIPAERWVVNVNAVGNTVAASIPLALADCLARNAFAEGDHILVVGFGAGLTWAGFLMQW